jgi:hypothetical protein
MGEATINVPYEDFVDYVCAYSKLSAIKQMVESGSDYCSDSIKAILGIEVKDAGTDRKQNAD